MDATDAEEDPLCHRPSMEEADPLCLRNEGNLTMAALVDAGNLTSMACVWMLLG